MSYSFAYPATSDRAVPRDKAAAAFAGSITPDDLEAKAAGCGGATADELAEHVQLAVDAIEALAGIGQPDDLVRVTVSGHVEPGHAQRPEWAPEFLQVSVTVQRPDVAAVPEVPAGT